MTSITTQNNTQNYQLNTQSGLTKQAGGTVSLASVLAGANTNLQTSSATNDAYMLDLSPEAQAYLSGGASNNFAASTSFTLSNDKQKAIDNIIAKYRDAPFTQATFDQIQADLRSAGLGVDQLSLKDKTESFNATQVLMDALSGKQTDPTSAAAASDEQVKAKADNYMESIRARWQAISTTADEADSSGEANSSASV